MDLEMILVYIAMFSCGALFGAGCLALYAIRVSKREKEKNERFEHEE